jgi:hypothetical protein
MNNIWGVNSMNENKTIFINLLIGIIGPVLLLITVLKFILNGNQSDFLISFLGFLLMITYINDLEKKAGISKKFIWIRVSSSIILFLVLGLFLLKG